MASGLEASSSLAVPLDGFGFGGGWFDGFVTTSCAALCFVLDVLAAAGLETLGSVASGLAVVRFKQHQVYCTDAAETTSVTKTA